jgi:hypothetical protein
VAGWESGLAAILGNLNMLQQLFEKVAASRKFSTPST